MPQDCYLFIIYLYFGTCEQSGQPCPFFMNIFVFDSASYVYNSSLFCDTSNRFQLITSGAKNLSKATLKRSDLTKRFDFPPRLAEMLYRVSQNKIYI